MSHEKFRKSIHSTEHVVLRTFLLERREELGLTQRELAGKIPVHYSVVGKIEVGDRRLDVVEFITYCKALDVDPRDVMGLIMESQN